MRKKLPLFLLLIIPLSTIAQSIPIGQAGTEDMLRVLQLSGKLDAGYSFTARPFYFNEKFSRNDLTFLIDSTAGRGREDISLWDDRIQLGLLPVIGIVKYNSHHPYGWNDAGMMMVKGLQTSFSAGWYAAVGPLSIQLQPEYVYSANPDYAITNWFGTNTGKSYAKLLPGQSAIRLNMGAVSLAASTENIWWGPGQFSSLLMSNNAPGFQHLGLHTNRPLKTPVGSFEWQLVVGKLDEDTSKPFENNYLKPLNPKNEWRYFNGIVLTYQPKWLPGIFLGATRSIHLYRKDFEKQRNSITGKYLPVIGGVFTSDKNIDPNEAPSDQALSLFARWVLPKHQAEFYLEYGYNDYKQNIRDLTTNANHASAYIAGFKKVIPLANHRLLDISGEITQMAQTTSYIVRNAGNWYIHSTVTPGLTHRNQTLGAGSGFGNNVQTISAKKIKGYDYIGLKLQRVQQDPKGFRGGVNTLLMGDYQWNDLSVGLLAQKRVKRFILNGELQFVNSVNYGWVEGKEFNLYVLLNFVYNW